ncbi:MAG: hypothetical protein OXI71_04470 [Gemmatimonadota bacterium]|nr:hypothetical protein [Gemmatimonadota bacterium]MDE2678020.1 hypothetical protein [Gemmatimonadota bacterium]
MVENEVDELREWTSRPEVRSGVTQNGQAAMVVMSPERYDFLVHSAERGHMWREAIRAHRAGEPGIPAREAIRELAEELGLEL